MQGFFEFHFSNDWANDLGTGLNDLDEIACYGVNGLVPIDSQITCILKHSTLSSKSIVVVKGFKEIPPNTKVRILISGVTNPNSPTYTLEIKVA